MKLSKKLLGKNVIVRWVDIWGSGSWRDAEKLPTEPCQCATIGCLMSITKETVTLVDSVNACDGTIQVGGWPVFPKEVIKSVKVLKG